MEQKKMKAVVFDAEFKPREGYKPTAREMQDKRALRGGMIWHNPVLELREADVPIPKDDEVLVKVGACGVCGSDMEMLNIDDEGYTGFVGHCKLPCIVGHECSGEIVAVGSKVKKFKTGDLITAEEMNWCGECDACKLGMFNQCMQLEELGLTIGGGFSEYFTVKEKYCFSVNKLAEVYRDRTKALEVAAMIEPTAVAYNAVVIRSGGIMPGSNVCVFGCGPVGLAAIGICKAAGAAKIIAFDFKEDRLEVAKKMNADITVNLGKLEGETPAEIILRETDNVGVMLAVEATGHFESTLPEIEQVLAPGAKIAQIGMSGKRSSVSALVLQMRAASYNGSIGNAGHGIYANVIRMLESGILDITPIIAARYDLDHAIEGIWAAKKGTAGKVLIKPEL